MAGNKDLFQWFCAVSNREDSLQSLVKIKPQSRKKMPYKGLLWLISFLVYFLLRMIQVGNVALPVSYQSFSSLDVDESGHHEN